jgi:hypothetical protein
VRPPYGFAVDIADWLRLKGVCRVRASTAMTGWQTVSLGLPLAATERDSAHGASLG